MATLKQALADNNIPEPLAVRIKTLFSEYKDEGYTAKDAAKAAVSDIIKEMDRQRAAISEV